MITVLTAGAALEHTCAIFRERADRGDIASEGDLLIDGAVLLAMHVDDLAREGCAGSAPGWPVVALAAPAERWPSQLQRHVPAGLAHWTE